jgi:hypothetical protein
MKTTPHTSRVYREVRIDRCLSAVCLVATTSIAIACRDTIESAVTPVSPTLNVSVDGGWVVNSLADPATANVPIASVRFAKRSRPHRMVTASRSRGT